MTKVMETMKAWAALVSAIAASLIATGIDGKAGFWLAIVVAIAGAILTWRVPNQDPPGELPADPYEDGYAAAVEQYDTPVATFDGPTQLEIADYEGEKFAPPIPDNDNR